MGYINGPDAQEQRGQVIEIFHLATGEVVQFRAFLTDFQDSFESEWNSEEVYGRMDPIQTFKGTKRTISLAWDCVAESHDDAKGNMEKCSKLFKMLYPTYEGTTMKAPPLVKMKFVNLITNTQSGTSQAVSAESGGLTGTIDGFAYSPDLEQGFFEDHGGAAVYPQTIALECTFIVLHTHELGANSSDGSDRMPAGFPYKPDEPRTPAGMTSPDAPMSVEASDGAAAGAQEAVGSTGRSAAEAVEGMSVDTGV